MLKQPRVPARLQALSVVVIIVALIIAAIVVSSSGALPLYSEAEVNTPPDAYPAPLSELPPPDVELAAEMTTFSACTGPGCRVFLPMTHKSVAAPVTTGPSTRLPSGDACKALIRRSTWEPRPDNNDENRYVARAGADYKAQPWGGTDPRVETLILPRVDGNFVGTTDEIIQWGACKWGFHPDLVRAIATQESSWRMSTVGDNGQSFGLMQIKQTAHGGTYPASAKSTAFNVDYALAWRRACYEGYLTYMKERNSRYRAGDEWGCVGAWYSGNWYDSGAKAYIGRVWEHYKARTWLKPGF